MLTRTLIVAALVLVTGVYTRGAREHEQPPGRTPLSHVPLSLSSWAGHEAPPFSDDVVAQLGADDYVHRYYTAGANAPIALYAGYYASQRHGDTIHSPQNCLPGAGWQPIFVDRHELTLAHGRVPVNRVIVQKGRDRQAVFYWYQGRGRITANEFAAKGWLMIDAARLRRTDGGLVRLITPVTSTREEAFSRLAAFTTALVPTLWAHLP